MCLQIGLVFFRTTNCSSFCQRLLRHNASVSGALFKIQRTRRLRVQRGFINGNGGAEKYLFRALNAGVRGQAEGIDKERKTRR